MKKLLAIAGLLVATQARAQVTGAVRDSISRQPIAGAVMTLLDGSGAVLGRLLTNERGEFGFQLPAAMKLRIQKIGFRPRDMEIPAGVARFDVALLAIPALLDSVKVVVNSRCSKRKDAAAAGALLLQARSGLLATIVARDSNPGALVRLAFERRRNPDTDVALSQRVRRDSTQQATMAFKAVHEGAWYVENGFQEMKDGQQIFYGPDAEVLLDDGFAAGYCFRVVDAPKERRGQIGLGFAESDHKKERIGIDGVLWVDTVARALRDIEYRYTGFQNLDRVRPGGLTSFREMKNGVVLITGWMIRLAKRLPDTTIAAGRTMVRQGIYTVEAGGEVIRARWPDGTKWEAPLGTVHIAARSASAKTPAAGVYLRLAGTDYWGQTDANGVMEIMGLEPGPYEVTSVDTTLIDLGLKPDTIARFVAARDSVVSLGLAVRRTADIVLDRCLANHQNAAKDGLLIGRVMSTAGQPVKNATVGLRFPGTNDDVYSMKTGDDGFFTACFGSARRGETYTIIARTVDGAADAQTKTFKDTVTSVKLVLDLPTPKGEAKGPLVSVEGIAWDSLRSAPLSGALIALSGSARTVVSDSAGHFRIDSVTPGRYVVTMQHDAIDALGMPSLAARTTIGTTGEKIQIGLPSFGTFWKALCTGQPTEGAAILYGTVTDSAGTPIKQSVKIGAEVKEDSVKRFLDRATDSTGAYAFCGLSPKAAVRIVVADPGFAGPIDLPPLEATRVVRRDIAIKRP